MAAEYKTFPIELALYRAQNVPLAISPAADLAKEVDEEIEKRWELCRELYNSGYYLHEDRLAHRIGGIQWARNLIEEMRDDGHDEG